MEKKQLLDEVYVIKNFFSQKECEEFVEFAEQKGFEEAKVNMDGKQVLMTMVRNNERVLHTNQNWANTFWLRLREFHDIPVGNSLPIGLNELFRFYKYTKHQRFKKHRDGSFIRNESEFSLYTFMVYLNDDFEGGATKFAEFDIVPETGMALIFKHEIKHEGSPVKDGVKYVFRSDIMYKLNE